jgi:hypothetical protein
VTEFFLKKCDQMWESVLDYLLKPVLKARTEAMRER